VTSLRRARYVPDRMSHGGDSRSLAVRRAKAPQTSVFAGRPRIVAETSQADSGYSTLAIFPVVILTR
jgi:hypothetical protein